MTQDFRKNSMAAVMLLTTATVSALGRLGIATHGSSIPAGVGGFEVDIEFLGNVFFLVQIQEASIKLEGVIYAKGDRLRIITHPAQIRDIREAKVVAACFDAGRSGVAEVLPKLP